MAYIKYNPNPDYKSRVGDCSVRAISKVFNTDWNTAYVKLCDMGLKMHDMPDSNMDELMQTLQITNPPLYNSVMRRIYG